MQPQHAAAMRQCLETMDLPRLRRLWKHVAPHLPQPATDAEAEPAAHMARTQAQSLPLRLRAYSHRWLTERGFPSGLPDNLKPRAERMYPRIVSAVGIAVGSRYPIVRQTIGDAMRDVVENAYADGKTDPDYIKPRMLEARETAKRKLFG